MWIDEPAGGNVMLVLERWFKRIEELEVLTKNIRGSIRDHESLSPLIGPYSGLLEVHFSVRLHELLKELRQINVPEKGFVKMLEFLEVDGKLMLIDSLQFFGKFSRLRPLDQNGIFPKEFSVFLEKVLNRLEAEKKAVESLKTYLDPGA